jgi:hypothetical protein
MITRYFNHELQILEVKYEGDIYLKDLIEFGNEICNDQSLPRVLRILTDVTHGRYRISVNEFPELIRILEQHVSAFEQMKAAYIQENPRETAYSVLLEKRVSIPAYKHAVFASREAALHWLIEKNV